MLTIEEKCFVLSASFKSNRVSRPECFAKSCPEKLRQNLQEKQENTNIELFFLFQIPPNILEYDFIKKIFYKSVLFFNGSDVLRKHMFTSYYDWLQMFLKSILQLNHLLPFSMASFHLILKLDAFLSQMTRNRFVEGVA